MTLVMGVLIISFGVWGIGDIFRGFGQSTLAKIGKTEISIEQFRQLYTDRLQQISRQIGRPIAPDQARAFGIDRQVLQQVIAETTLDESAHKLGLKVSTDEIMKSITNDPNFSGLPAACSDNGTQFLVTWDHGIGDQGIIRGRRYSAPWRWG